jgi:anti-sigma-K factor RskA
MAMSEQGASDRSGLAAEYVLGTLDRLEKAQAEALMQSDKAFAAEVEAWRLRFDPLLDAPPAPPPAGALEGILAAIDAEKAQPDAEILVLRRKLAVWKRAAVVAGALAASLLAFLAIQLRQPPNLPSYVAVLESPDKKAAFVAAASLGDGGLSIRRVGAPAPAGRSFELWAIREGTQPESLGVVDDTLVIPARRLIQRTGGVPLGKVVLAITEEPQGGSPNGKPSGPPVFAGKLLQTPAL